MAQARDRVKNALVAKPLFNRREPPPIPPSTGKVTAKALVGPLSQRRRSVDQKSVV